MIELFKADGTVKARAKLLYDFTEVKVNEAKELWLKDMQVEFDSTVHDEEISFDEWLNLEEVVQEATEESEAVYAKAREFAAPEVTEVMLDEYLGTIQSYGKGYGEMYGAYRIPFKNEDAMAMLQVKAAFEMGVTSTNIEFSNGTVMPMDAEGLAEFGAWFVTKRNSYFV